LYESEDAASAAFQMLLRDVQEGSVLNDPAHTEIIGDESFWVEYDQPALFLVYMVTARFKTLIYQFRWECTDYGGARDGQRLMEAVVARADETVTTQKQLAGLLPTADEAKQYGLAEETRT